MKNNKAGAWVRGYLDAIQEDDRVSKKQLELLISRVMDIITEVEKERLLRLSQSYPGLYKNSVK